MGRSGRIPALRIPWNPWAIAISAIALLIATPMLVVFSSVLTNQGEIWGHLVTTVLPRYLGNSLGLALGVSGGVLLLGVSTGWLVTLCRFPGRWLFEWALLLPLAAPAYILAYVYTDFLEYYGPVQMTLRQWFGWETMHDYWFPPVRSLGGAIVMFSLTLYPYVYLLARVAFLEQSRRTLEASRNLGCGPWRSFWVVALPLARPSIMAGLALALMETLNDYGTVKFFGVDTFTTGIYRTWFGIGERQGAAQLSAVLLVFILLLISGEQWFRRQARYYQSKTLAEAEGGYGLGGMRAIAAIVTCSLPVALGLLLPGGLLLQMTLANLDKSFDATYWHLTSNSLILATVTAGVGVLLALVMAYGLRLSPNWVVTSGVRLAAMGYAIPGAVIAVGLLVPLGWIDRTLNTTLQAQFGFSPGLLLSGTAIALVLGYLVRFLAVAFNTVESSLTRISPSLDDASRSLGQTPLGTLWRVHFPLLRGGLLTAVMLVFVDVMKELPATLVMRPLNFDTLAVQTFRYAADELPDRAAAPALTIVLVGLLPVILLSWQVAKSRRSRSGSA
ncbi:iron ABC transporter permease [Prochlorothrix hollandica PCC 9006 = CALU 1027]|uniref:Iron ABC transporter permease n=2 Tax=Prochlorothrix hollandica TaxID=1223 RepID=A0A0M2PYX7_PROHO|nr:iron ABC transporter permease [Prochlorothrix hollandica PCC 9006 = CALU 1027]